MTGRISNYRSRIGGHAAEALITGRRPHQITIRTGSPWTAFGATSRH